MHILIFKTNINTLTQLNRIKPLLNAIPAILKWTIDQQDIDNVLRIEAKEHVPDHIQSKLRDEGYFCEDLPD